MTFAVTTFLAVPACIFGISAIFASILWAVECSKAKDEFGDEYEAQAPGICDFYEWWKYIVGNLVGLGNPITDVSPISGHVGSEILDLLVSVWSLTAGAFVIGYIATLTWVTMAANSADAYMSKRFERLFTLRADARRLAADVSGLSLEEFITLCTEKNLSMSSARIREVFEECDVNGNGVITAEEVEPLLKRLQEEEEMDEEPALEKKVDGLNTRVQNIDSKLDALMEMLKAMKHVESVSCE